MTYAPYTEARFAKAFAAGLFNLDGGKATHYWIGADGNFWVEWYFPATYQRIAHPRAKVAN
jgi:hypothetical protein